MAGESQQVQVVGGVSVPVIQWERFAELVGLEQGVLRGLIEKGHVPSLKIGKHRFVNVAKLSEMCLGGVR